MVDVKQLLLDQLNELDLPDGIKTFLSTPIPAPPAAPGTVDEAIIATGTLSAYFTALLTSFAGLTPVDLLLRAGQKNATLQAIALSGLELAREATPHDYEIVSPKDGQAYYEPLIDLRIKITDGKNDFNGASVSTNNNPSAEMVYDGATGTFVFENEFPTGEHTVTFFVAFKPHYLITKTVNFDVALDSP